MEPTCLRHSELPHSSRLFQDVLYHFDRVKEWYAFAPGPLASYQQAAKQVRFAPEQRAALIAALREQNGDTPTLELLSQQDTVAIVTGQQVGLFGGPAYTIYKALSAVRLARELTAQGTPAVPVFWLATEDHDFAEVDHYWIYNAAHEPVKLTVGRVGEGQEPVGQVPLAAYPLDELDRNFAGLPFADDVLAKVAPAYQTGMRLGQSFRLLLANLLQPYGLLFMDPLQPSIRALAAPLLRRAVEAAPDLNRLLLERSQQLTDRGYHAQVHVEADTSLVFLLENGRRTALKHRQGEYQVRDRRYSPAELMDRAEQLSPNALLRPVVQDSMLPTAAYIGGPAELAYMAQSEVLYRHLLGRMPVMAPRSGYTLIAPRVAKLLTRYRLSLPEFFGGEAALQEQMASRLVPGALHEQFERSRETIDHAIAGLRKQVLAFDPTLAAALDGSTAKMQYQIQKAERKVAREVMRRTERATGDAAYLNHVLYPHKTLQERFYGILPFLAEHGLGIIDQIYAHVHLDCPDHILLPIA